MSGTLNPSYVESGRGTLEASRSAISWPAIFGGMAASVAASLILLTLGSGFGLAWASPWSDRGPSAGTLTVVMIVWIIVVQWIAAGLGGYLTGRLRTKWVGTHTHEVFFRDTAHGFLTWSAATLFGVLVVASASSALVGGAVQATATVGAGAAHGAAAAAPAALDARGYAVDTLFRSAQPAAGNAADSRAEAGRIVTEGMVNGDLSNADRSYLSQLVATQAGISPADAQKRVDDMVAQTKATAAKVADAADKARKAAAKLSIFLGLSMLIGAFIACAAAALGGQQRDEHP